jgi:DNA topoisomerase VI subunit B
MRLMPVRPRRSPEISIRLEPDALIVEDNGPGIPASTIERSLDYRIRVSDKKHYVSPTRGQLGNALKCVWAAPFVANGTHHGLVEVTARGQHHRIEVSVDQIKQAPAIDYSPTEASVKTGTLVKVHWKGIASYEGRYAQTFYQRQTLAEDLADLLAEFAAFNPHGTFHFGERHFPASDPEWRKWRTDQPTSAHWYRVSDLRNLIAAYLAEGDRPVRDFLAEFHGLSGTQTRSKVLAASGITGTHLRHFVIEGKVDVSKVTCLLAAMREHSRPIKPQYLGSIGKTHLEKALNAAGAEGCRYWKKEDIDEEGLPFVIETAFGVREDEKRARRLIVGLNWAPIFKVPSGIIAEALSSCRVEDTDPVVWLIHLVRPRFAFTDHGKGALAE